MKNIATPLWILVGLTAIITVSVLGNKMHYRSYPDKIPGLDAMREHCKTMPEMKGCEKYNTGSSAMMDMGGKMMDHSSMITSEESFVVNMIPHHQEAVDTARLVVAKGSNPELRELAQHIITAQEKEIAMMNQWKIDWNYTATPTYENMMGDGSKLSGEELDRWFLQGMIMHHKGAIEMAKAVLKLNPRQEISNFSREIIRAQSEEIEKMHSIFMDYIDKEFRNE